MTDTQRAPIEATLTLTLTGYTVSYNILGQTLAEIEAQWPKVMAGAAGYLSHTVPAEHEPPLPFEQP
jgi:hypothetical protein